LIAGAIAAWQHVRVKPSLDNLFLGARGEREVGRALEAMRTLGYEVFHDIPGDGFNVDHALIGPGGVFAIETKTISKRRSSEAKIEYDGQRVLIDGQAPDRDPIAQACGSAAHLRDLIRRTTDREVAVRPVVVFPGWYTTPQPRGADVWVLNLPGLRSFLEHEPARLSREDIALYRDRLVLVLSSETRSDS
jgi:hypothetical protein